VLRTGRTADLGIWYSVSLIVTRSVTTACALDVPCRAPGLFARWAGVLLPTSGQARFVWICSNVCSRLPSWGCSVRTGGAATTRSAARTGTSGDRARSSWAGCCATVRQRLQLRPRDRPGTWLCTVPRPTAGRSGTSHGTSRAKSRGACAKRLVLSIGFDDRVWPVTAAQPGIQFAPQVLPDRPAIAAAAPAATPRPPPAAQRAGHRPAPAWPAAKLSPAARKRLRRSCQPCGISATGYWEGRPSLPRWARR
jgi:hypothetical protein